MNAKTISAADFIAQHNQENLNIIDLRTPAEVEGECLGGCVSLPVQELNESSFAQALASAENQQGPVYLLCQSGRRAQMAVDKLQGKTDRELIIIEGGLNACKQIGVTTEGSGRQIMSLERQVRIAAGALVVLGVILGSTIAPAFYGISAFVGAGLMFAGITDTCGMAMMLAAMPWNKASKGAKTCSV